MENMESYSCHENYIKLNICTCTNIKTLKNKNKTKNISIKSVNSNNVSIMVVIFYCSFTRCYQKGKLGKVYTRSLCIVFFLIFIYLFLERGEGREKERERNINVWLPLMHPLLGTRPTIQAGESNR